MNTYKLKIFSWLKVLYTIVALFVSGISSQVAFAERLFAERLVVHVQLLTDAQLSQVEAQFTTPGETVSLGTPLTGGESPDEIILNAHSGPDGNLAYTIQPDDYDAATWKGLNVDTSVSPYEVTFTPEYVANELKGMGILDLDKVDIRVIACECTNFGNSLSKILGSDSIRVFTTSGIYHDARGGGGVTPKDWAKYVLDNNYSIDPGDEIRVYFSPLDATKKFSSWTQFTEGKLHKFIPAEYTFLDGGSFKFSELRGRWIVHDPKTGKNTFFCGS